MNTAACGLTWTPHWSSPGESAYTLLAKMSIANPLPLKTLQKVLMGTRCEFDENGRVHRRTLLSNKWMIAARADERCDWSRALTQATLDDVLDLWTQRLGGDQALRYCPSCLALGFHSPLCQIEGLQVCPVHGDTLRNTCGHCEAPMPRFAWDGAFSDGWAMHCTRCGQPFAHAWALASHLRWRPMPGAERYGTLALKLGAVRGVQWLNHPDAWDAGLSWIDGAERRRYEYALVQGALQRMQSARMRVASPYIEEWLDLPLLNHIDSVEGASAHAPRAYEQTWRRISRAAHWTAGSERTWIQYYSGLLEPNDFRNPETIAAYLFRCRFERATSPSSPPRGLRTRDFRVSVESLADLFDLDLRRWQRVFAACHRAELRFARLMRDRTAGMSRGSPGWTQTLVDHEPGLSRARILPWGAATLRVQCGGTVSGLLAFPKLPAATEYPTHPSLRKAPAAEIN